MTTLLPHSTFLFQIEEHLRTRFWEAVSPDVIRFDHSQKLRRIRKRFRRKPIIPYQGSPRVLSNHKNRYNTLMGAAKFASSFIVCRQNKTHWRRYCCRVFHGNINTCTRFCHCILLCDSKGPLYKAD